MEETLLKKKCLFLCCILLTGFAFAQESFSIGGGVQANDYSRDFIAAGGLVNTDFRFGELISVGTAFLFSLDLGLILNNSQKMPLMTVAEVSFNLRWYFLRFERLVDYYFLWQNYLHWFIQGDIGLSVIGVGTTSMPSAALGIPLMLGITAGVRIMIGNSYFEPYIRLGEPFLWGAGFVVGKRITGMEYWVD